MRRSHAAALAALAALLLLLLARLPPAPAPVHPRASLPSPAPASGAAPAPAAAPADADALPDNRTVASPPSSERAPPAAPAARAPGPAPAGNASAAAAAGGERPLLVSDVYVAGHSSPHPELCPSLGARLRLLVLVTSAPAHAAARDAVRLTWGHYAARSDVALAFVLGAPPPELAARLAAEDALYGDLVVGRALDSYANLTLKTLSMLEWAATYCPRAPRLLKTDDDMFINVPRLLRFAAARGEARSVWGRVARRWLPIRTPRSKYYVSAAQFPERVYPDFATGPAYLVSADSVRPLLAAARAPGRRYLPLEDVFVTGVLAAAAGVARRHAPEFYNRRVATHVCAVQRGVAIHMVRPADQYDLWKKLHDTRAKCDT